NLNQSPAFYGFTTDSPAPEANYPTWNYVDGYTVVVRGSTFGASGFGGVTIPLVHNSPSKSQPDAFSPMPCGGCITNIATATGRCLNLAVSASAQAVVCINTNRLGALGDFVWYDINGNGIQDSGEPGVPGVTVQLRNCAGSL